MIYKTTMTRFWILGVFTLVLTQSLFAQYFWNNPSIQNNNLYDVHYYNSNTIYACGELGTLLKSTDKGFNWRITHRLQNVFTDFKSITFTDQFNGWIIGDYGEILRSFDGGYNWSRQSSPTTKNLRKVFALRWDKAWAVGENGAILYAPNGYSFSTQSSNTIRNLNSIFFIDDQNGFAVGDSGVMLKTINAGTSWQTFSLPLIKKNIYDIFFPSQFRGYAVGDSGLILRTTNGGLRWDIIANNISVSNFRTVFFRDENKGWAIGNESRIFYTTNGGSTWTSQNSPTWRTLFGAHFISDQEGFIVGDWGTILKTTNSGISWAQLNQGIDEYLNKSWFINENIGWIAGDRGVMLKTTNGGFSWLKVPTLNRWNQPMTADINAVQFLDENNGFAIGDSGYFSYTTNGGNEWYFYHHNALNRMDDLFGLHFLDSYNGWVVGGYWSQPVFLKTTDRGQSWHIWRPWGVWADLYHAAVPLHVNMLSYSRGWASGRTGVLRYTVNGGGNWQYYDPNILGFGDWLNWIHFIDYNTGWTCGKAGKIFKTTNSGLTWFEQYSGTNRELYSIYFADANFGMICGEDGTILRSTDGGTSWVGLPKMTNGRLKSIFKASSSTWYISGDRGLIFKTTNAGTTFVEMSNPIPELFELKQNYPNPFNSMTTIEFVLNQSSDIELNLFNSLGEKISIIAKGFFTAGKQIVSLDTKHNNLDLSSGVYFIRLNSGLLQKTIKAIYLK